VDAVSPITTDCERIGVLLVNLGTPEAADYRAVRRYLKEFLSDRRVVETNPLLWWPVLNFIILPLRPRQRAKDYAEIWIAASDEAPLRAITRMQAEKLALWVEAGGLAAAASVQVDWAMRYGTPSIEERLLALKAQGCDRVLLVPLYPQYAAATTATVCDAAFSALKRMRHQPTLRVAQPYYRNPAYIDALVASMKDELAQIDFVPEAILVSFHGMPRTYAEKGDPYPAQCIETWRLLRERLGRSAAEMPMSFQSRFGPTDWLKPYTDETVKDLARRGVKRLAVLMPGFAADCLETLAEVGIENRAYFIAAGGEKFAALPCLNASPPGMALLQHLLRQELAGWI